MLRKIKSIINGSWIQDIIDNFDPYEINQYTDIELNKNYNEELKLKHKEKTNGILGKD